jgi:hypothetical protein
VRDDPAGKRNGEVVVILTDVEEELLKRGRSVELAVVELRQAVHVAIQVLESELNTFFFVTD